MKKIVFILWLSVMTTMVLGQLKTQEQKPAVKDQLGTPVSSVVAGFLNSDKLEMHHSFAMSYLSFAGYGMMLNSYMNTIDYQFSSPLSLHLNLGLMSSPYNSLPNGAAFNDIKFFGGAELLYKPSKNTQLSLGVDYRPIYNGFYSPLRMKQ